MIIDMFLIWLSAQKTHLKLVKMPKYFNGIENLKKIWYNIPVNNYKR